MISAERRCPVTLPGGNTLMRTNKQKGVLFNHFGFTVLELTAVVGVFAIVSAIALPDFLARLPHYRVNGAARVVLGELLWARGKAVEENNQFVVFFPTGNYITTLDDTNNNGIMDAGEKTRTRNIQTDYPGVTLSKNAGDPDPAFSTRGTAAGTTTITLTASGESRTVTVNLTGSVKIN